MCDVDVFRLGKVPTGCTIDTLRTEADSLMHCSILYLLDDDNDDHDDDDDDHHHHHHQDGDGDGHGHGHDEADDGDGGGAIDDIGHHGYSRKFTIPFSSVLPAQIPPRGLEKLELHRDSLRLTKTCSAGAKFARVKGQHMVVMRLGRMW